MFRSSLITRREEKQSCLYEEGGRCHDNTYEGNAENSDESWLFQVKLLARLIQLNSLACRRVLFEMLRCGARRRLRESQKAHRKTLWHKMRKTRTVVIASERKSAGAAFFSKECWGCAQVLCFFSRLVHQKQLEKMTKALVSWKIHSFLNVSDVDFGYLDILHVKFKTETELHPSSFCCLDEFKSFLKRLPSTHFLPIGSVHLLWGSDWDLQARYRLLQTSLEIQQLKIQHTARKLFGLSIRCHHNPNHQMPRERWVAGWPLLSLNSQVLQNPTWK